MHPGLITEFSCSLRRRCVFAVVVLLPAVLGMETTQAAASREVTEVAPIKDHGATDHQAPTTTGGAVVHLIYAAYGTWKSNHARNRDCVLGR